MRILTWNIRHGGKYLTEIAASIKKHDPDLLVLTEYRTKSAQIAQILRDNGWTYQIDSSPEPNTNGIFIASKKEMQGMASVREFESDSQRWLEVFLPTEGVSILGVHIPDFNRDKTYRKRVFWEAVYEYAKDNQERPSVIIGDYNTGLKIDGEGAPFQEHRFMTKLLELGWVDAWRALHPDERDFTWWSNSRGVRNGFRLDYAFLSPRLGSQLLSADHSHHERETGYSDHSLLLIEINDCNLT
jgi:exodeoxyribonuclease III